MRAGKKAAGSWGGVGLSSASGGNHVPHKCSVWPPWLRAGCGKRRGVPGKASSRDAVCPQLVTLISVHFPTELLRGWTRRPSSHRGTLKRKVTRKGKYRTPVVKFEESLRSSPSQDMTSFCPTGYWGPLFSWQLLLLQTLGSPSAHQMK